MSTQLNDDVNIIANSDLEITYFEGDVNIIQKLDDEPNDVGGLTSAELKAKFDEGANIIKNFINDSLIPELLAADATEAARAAAEADRKNNESIRISNENARIAAEKARVDETSGVVAQATKQAAAAADSAKRAEQAALGQIPDGSITAAKLADDVNYNAVGAAPAGYGNHGEVLPVLDGTESELEQQFSEIVTNMPNLTSRQVAFLCRDGTLSGAGRFFATIYKMANTYAHVIASGYDGSYIVYKCLSNGAWWPFAWEKPIMSLGVEYRTTERYFGRTVYKKSVEFGTLPNATTKSVDIGADNIGAAFIDLSQSLVFVTADGWQSRQNMLPDVNIENGAIQIKTTSDLSAYSAHICVKYTKTAG